MLRNSLANGEHHMRVTREPVIHTTTWRDRILEITGDTSVLDDDDPSLDEPLEIATDIPALVAFVQSVLCATSWCVRSSVGTGSPHVLFSDRRQGLGPRDTLDYLRTWLIQHSKAYSYDHPVVANEMVSLAYTLWDLMDCPTGEHLYDTLMNIHL